MIGTSAASRVVLGVGVGVGSGVGIGVGSGVGIGVGSGVGRIDKIFLSTYSTNFKQRIENLPHVNKIR
jgi:hypothetical protein